MTAFRESASKVRGCISLAKRNHDTFGRDFEELISQKLTFEEGIRDGAFSIMSKQRIKVLQRDVFEQLTALAL
jgi:hypothetical protein